MEEIFTAFSQAMQLLLGADPTLGGIIGRTLLVSLSAVALATVVALPLGGVLALYPFPGRGAVVILLNAFMGLPPVVVGLVVYLLLSRGGPLGGLGLLFTPTAMIIAQCVLIIPIVAALARQVVLELWGEYGEQLRSLGAPRWRALFTLLYDGRHSLFTVVLAGFGRAIAEVGAVLIVGGNIAHVTRVMTTAIALETSKGDLALALALGLVLIALSLTVNGAVAMIQAWSRPTPRGA